MVVLAGNSREIPGNQSTVATAWPSGGRRRWSGLLDQAACVGQFYVQSLDERCGQESTVTVRVLVWMAARKRLFCLAGTCAHGLLASSPIRAEVVEDQSNQTAVENARFENTRTPLESLVGLARMSRESSFRDPTIGSGRTMATFARVGQGGRRPVRRPQWLDAFPAARRLPGSRTDGQLGFAGGRERGSGPVTHATWPALASWASCRRLAGTPLEGYGPRGKTSSAMSTFPAGDPRRLATAAGGTPSMPGALQARTHRLKNARLRQNSVRKRAILWLLLNCNLNAGAFLARFYESAHRIRASKHPSKVLPNSGLK